MKFSIKLLSLLLTLALLFSLLVGCNNSTPTETPSADDTATEAPDDTEQTPEPEVFEGINIDGVPLSQYVIVYPARGTIYEKYAAENLSASIWGAYGIEIAIHNDRTEEAEHEILIGNTNREESAIEHEPLADGEFILCQNGSKILCLGDTYMVGGGAGELLSLLPATVEDVNITLPTEPTPKLFTVKEAKSAILMIGDGMGFNTIDMAYPRFTETFAAALLPIQGEIRTASMTTLSNSSTPTDSAASGTALATGYKTSNGRIGMDKDAQSLKNLRELAFESGAKTGVLTTDAITGATPAAFLAHTSDRNNTDIIQQQINRLKRSSAVDVVEGSIGDTLTDVVGDALYKLCAEDSSFFLMVEEGYIDKNSHNKKMTECINVVKRFHDSIAYVIEFVLCHPDTVLIVTADHETGAIRKNADGSFSYTSGDHSTSNVPIFAIGDGTEIFNAKSSDNTEIPKFLAKIFSDDAFGDKQVY